MRGRLTALLALIVSIVALSVASPAHGLDPEGIPETTDELLAIYGITDAPADYVVAVDTSGSMSQAPAIYPAVRRAYASFVKAVGDQDHLSVITFDTSPTVQFNGRLGPHRADAEAALPRRARGAHTDIGAAVDAALERMGRADAATVQTLVFLTDGRIEAPDSPYAKKRSAAWKRLRSRADKLAATRSVAVYGAGLGGDSTDIAVLKDVFPRAQIVNLPTNQLAAFFKEAVRRARVERLRVPVTRELERNVVQAVVEPGELGDSTTLRVRFDSKLPHLGATINVRGIAVTDGNGEPLQATLVGGPRSITVGPEHVSDPFDVRVEVPGLDHSLRVGQVEDARKLAVTVDATLEVEPAAVLAKELGIDVGPQLVQADEATARRLHGLAYWMIGALAIALALFLVFLVWLYRRFVAVPKLRGGVEWLEGNDLHQEFFRGRQEEIPNKRISFNGGGSSVVFFTKPRSFSRPLSVRNPRLWVRIEDGSNVTVTSYGADQPLVAPMIVGPTDQLQIGSTRLTVIADAYKRR